MVEDSRFELLTHACKAHVFPISTNPPLNIKLCLILFLKVNQTISFTPCTTAMMFATWWNILRMTISNFLWSFSFFTKSSRHMILLILVSVEGIKPSTHGPKPRMLSLHYTELIGTPSRDRTADLRLVRALLYRWANDALGCRMSTDLMLQLSQSWVLPLH